MERYVLTPEQAHGLVRSAQWGRSVFREKDAHARINALARYDAFAAIVQGNSAGLYVTTTRPISITSLTKSAAMTYLTANGIKPEVSKDAAE